MALSKPKKYPLLLSALSICIIYFLNSVISFDGQKILSLAMLALMAGLLYESFTIADKWLYVVGIFAGALVFSLCSFLPGKHEVGYDFAKHLQQWPYVFLFMYLLFSVIAYKDETTIKLTEGVTLMQSMAIIYWLADYQFIHLKNWMGITVIVIGVFFVAYSLFNAFTYVNLSRSNRLTLSIWSSIIMLLFSADNIIAVYTQRNIEEVAFLTDKVYIQLQYFLLGVSSMYIAQNIMLLMGFLPGKGSFFNSRYFNEVQELKKDHIERYSDNQIHIGHAIVCVIVNGTFYFVNYKFELLPAHIAIMLSFFLFPPFLRIITTGRIY